MLPGLPPGMVKSIFCSARHTRWMLLTVSLQYTDCSDNNFSTLVNAPDVFFRRLFASDSSGAQQKCERTASRVTAFTYCPSVVLYSSPVADIASSNALS